MIVETFFHIRNGTICDVVGVVFSYLAFYGGLVVTRYDVVGVYLDYQVDDDVDYPTFQYMTVRFV